MRRIAIIVAAAIGVGAFALDRYGRARTRKELDSFGRLEAAAIASSLPVKDAIAAGARALLGTAALPQTVAVAEVN